MADKDAATPPGAAAIPDLNDPAVRLDRNSALQAMLARRRETVLADMEPEDAQELASQNRAAIAADAAKAAGVDPAAVALDDDTDPADSIAAAARTALERTDGAPAAIGVTEPEPAPSQIDAQTQDQPIELTPEQLARYVVRSKVNGVEQVRSVEDVLRDAQKTNAADAYLATAKETLGEARLLKSQLEKQIESPATTSTPATESPTTGEPDPADQFVDALFHGDDAKARELARRMAKPAAPVLDPNRLASEVEAKLVIRSALRQFAKDHRDIVADPIARSIADGHIDAALKKRGLGRLEDAPAEQVPEIIREAGTATKDYFRRMSGIASPQPTVATTALADRQADKARIAEPAVASTRAASTVQAPRTTSDVIASMRAARQPQMAEPTRR